MGNADQGLTPLPQAQSKQVDCTVFGNHPVDINAGSGYGDAGGNERDNPGDGAALCGRWQAEDGFTALGVACAPQEIALAAYAAEFGVDFVKAHRAAVGRLAALGLARVEDGFLRLTREGMEVQNAVVVELLDE